MSINPKNFADKSNTQQDREASSNKFKAVDKQGEF